MYVCVDKHIHTNIHVYSFIYIVICIYFSIPNKITCSDKYVCIIHAGFLSREHLFTSSALYDLWHVFENTHHHQLFHHSKIPLPFSALRVCTQDHAFSTRSQSFFLCAFRKNKGATEVHDTEDKCENTITIGNGVPCDSLDMKGGHRNDAFMTEDERLTPLWRAAVLLPQDTQHLFSATAEHHTLSRADYTFSFIILLS